jgi:hypothetical protein
MLPWNKQSERGSYQAYTNHRNGRFAGAGPVQYIREYLDDNPAMYLRKGDIVKFYDGFIKILPHNWQRWFLKPGDKKKFYPRDKRVPRYAVNQYAIIAGRYRKIKFKYRTFYDYGCVVMMLTGESAGHMRHYWSSRPFDLKIPFPKPLTQKYIQKALPTNILEILNMHYDDSNASRNLLLDRLYMHFRRSNS